MKSLPLDAHAHLDAMLPARAIARAGFVLAMTLSSDEARIALARADERAVWGVGCHPRRVRAVRAFDRDEFTELARRSPLIGEIGLDLTSRVPMPAQRATFRAALAVACALGRVVSIHPHRTSSAVLDELRRRMPPAAILHWWSGNDEETRRAVALGCYFSVHRAVARLRIWQDVPPERLLVESDIRYADPPASSPTSVARTEVLLAARTAARPEEIRAGAWRALRAIIAASRSHALWPRPFLDQVRSEVSVR
ncbi:MAG: TatD family deoxyribonuclease [Chloroflexi bacterium]|nr:MAG: TatD family deoxyribonuclease [Chloroflexota bacterium]